MERLLEIYLRMQEDVSVVGCYGIELVRLLRVPLAAVHQPEFKMGETAAAELPSGLEGKVGGGARGRSW